MKFIFTLCYPKGSKKNWPKCHSGQSVTLAKVSPDKVKMASVILPEVSRPKCNSANFYRPTELSLLKEFPKIVSLSNSSYTLPSESAVQKISMSTGYAI